MTLVPALLPAQKENNMVYRVYVEKKRELAHEANALKNDIVNLLQIKELKDLRILNYVVFYI